MNDNKPTPKRNNILRLAGVINSANREADDEAAALIQRVKNNHRRTLGLIAKAHENETLKEAAIKEAEKEQALADLAAAIGDNGGPALDDDDAFFEEDEKAREALRQSKRSGDGDTTHHQDEISKAQKPVL